MNLLDYYSDANFAEKPIIKRILHITKKRGCRVNGMKTVDAAAYFCVKKEPYMHKTYRVHGKILS